MSIVMSLVMSTVLSGGTPLILPMVLSLVLSMVQVLDTPQIQKDCMWGTPPPGYRQTVCRGAGLSLK